MLKVSVFFRGMSAHRHELEHDAGRADAQSVTGAELHFTRDLLAVHEAAVAAVVANPRPAAHALQRAVQARDSFARASQRNAPVRTLVMLALGWRVAYENAQGYYFII